MTRAVRLIGLLTLSVVSIAAPHAQSPALQEYERLIPGAITDLAIGPDNRLYVTGMTANPAFPVTPNAYDARCDNCRSLDGEDGFLLVLAPTGALEYGTFLGGQATEWNLRVALASDGGVWIAGNTVSGEFAPKRNPGECLRGPAMFLARLRPGLPSLDDFRCLTGVALASTPPPLVPLESPGGDLAIDPEGDVWILGAAVPGFPPRNAWQPVAAGSVDAFLMEFSPREPVHTYAGYIGGRGDDYATGLAILSDGDVVVAGQTHSQDFPAIRAFQPSRQPGELQTDGFVIRFDASGRFVRYSTYFGGSGVESVYGVAGDRDGRVFLTGRTTSRDFPVTVGAVDSICGHDPQCINSPDAYLLSLREDGLLGSSTLIGGSADDSGRYVAVLPGGGVVVAGDTHSIDFPLVNHRPALWPPETATGVPFAALLDVPATRYERSTIIPMVQRPVLWQAFAADDRFLYAAARGGGATSILRRIPTR